MYIGFKEGCACIKTCLKAYSIVTLFQCIKPKKPDIQKSGDH